MNLRLHVVRLLFGHAALLDQLILIDPGNRSHLLYLFVHEWLSELGLIQLVVAHFSVTNQVDDNIMVKLLSVLSSSLENVINIFHGVGVDVEDWG